MVKVRVPATTANLGPGFDTMGLALSLYNDFSFYESEGKKDFDDQNLIYLAAKKLYDSLGRDIGNLRFTVEAEIPRSRGLGSSAACIIGGLMGANGLLGQPLSQDEILAMATELEGHPDNVAPALLGGCVFSAMESGQPIYHRLEGLEKIKPYVAIPDFTLETSLARKSLPKMLTYEDAVYNISRMPFLVEGMRTSDMDMIMEGTKDRLHEPYRKKLIHGYPQMRQIEEAFKGRMLISGAGPSLIFITLEGGKSQDQDIVGYWEEMSKETGYKWRILPVKIEEKGAVYL